MEYFTLSPLVGRFTILADVINADESCGISNKPSYNWVVATDDAVEVGVKGTAKGPNLAGDELICILDKPITSGLTTNGILRHSFVTPVLFNFVAYSYYCRLVVSLEDDVSETCCVNVFQNLLGDKIVNALLWNHISNTEYSLSSFNVSMGVAPSVSFSRKNI